MWLQQGRFGQPQSGDPIITPLPLRCGFVFTTHKTYGALAAECLHTLFPQLALIQSSVLDVYLNEPTAETRRIVQAALKNVPSTCSVRITTIHDQAANAVLTGTWNRGASYCLEQGCDVVTLVNHDIHFNRTLLHLLQATGRSDVLGPVGCLMLGLVQTEWQRPVDGKAVMTIGSDRIVAVPHHDCLHGALLSVNRATLERMVVDPAKAAPFRRSYTMYFDENFPTGGNENEFHARWSRRYQGVDSRGSTGPVAWVVTSSIQAHASLGTWHSEARVKQREDFYETTKGMLQHLAKAAETRDVVALSETVTRFAKLQQQQLDLEASDRSDDQPLPENTQPTTSDRGQSSGVTGLAWLGAAAMVLVLLGVLAALAVIRWRSVAGSASSRHRKPAFHADGRRT